MTAYEELIARKSASSAPVGFKKVDDIAAHLYPHQRDLVSWALRRGRSAVFANTGLGKGLILLEWARHVSKLGRVLVLAPLAVGPQLAQEAKRFGVDATFSRSDDGSRILICNYEMLHVIDPTLFTGVVLDESSILKSYSGATRTALIDAFAATPYRLACTATPAPNDFTELGNHAEFLGLKRRVEMLAEYFYHDGGSTSDWHIKGHAVVPFWRWVATWGAVVNMPSDLGHDDSAFRLPPIEMVDHVVPAGDHDIAATGQLFATDAMTLADQRAVRRQSIDARSSLAARLASDGNQHVVWCELNDEQDAVVDELGDACVSIDGSTDDDDKIEMHDRWLRGDVKVLVTKPAIFGFGLNWQHCASQVFIGASHSYERTYQAIRRVWRFGQTRTVTIHMIRTDRDGSVIDNYRRKERDAEKMGRAMSAHVLESVRAEVLGLSREFNPYKPAAAMSVPAWLT